MSHSGMFQSLIGILVNWNDTVVTRPSNTRRFQSLIGILVNWNLIAAYSNQKNHVSIPNRDFS